jgi:alpha/beta superfamily hydrolase
MRSVLTAILPGVALALALLWLGQRRLIYLPFGHVPPAVSVGLPQAEGVTFTTDDGVKLNGWFVRADSSPARFTMIVFNGNAGNRAMRAPLAAALARHGVATLLFDYRGYGENAGRPSENGLALDARAAHAWVTARADVDTSRVVLFGESLGAAVALRLATETPPFALPAALREDVRPEFRFGDHCNLGAHAVEKATNGIGEVVRQVAVADAVAEQVLHLLRACRRHRRDHDAMLGIALDERTHEGSRRANLANRDRMPTSGLTGPPSTSTGHPRSGSPSP